jgi:hypothetical protein
MTCYKAKYSGTLKANSEIDELKWLNHKDLDIISEVKKIFSFLNEKRIKNMFRRLSSNEKRTKTPTTFLSLYA